MVLYLGPPGLGARIRYAHVGLGHDAAVLGNRTEIWLSDAPLALFRLVGMLKPLLPCRCPTDHNCHSTPGAPTQQVRSTSPSQHPCSHIQALFSNAVHAYTVHPLSHFWVAAAPVGFAAEFLGGQCSAPCYLAVSRTSRPTLIPFPQPRLYLRLQMATHTPPTPALVSTTVLLSSVESTHPRYARSNGLPPPSLLTTEVWATRALASTNNIFRPWPEEALLHKGLASRCSRDTIHLLFCPRFSNAKARACSAAVLASFAVLTGGLDGTSHQPVGYQRRAHY